MLLVLAGAVSAVLAAGAQAHKKSEQHVIVKLSCTKVTFLYLGFPEGVTNYVHEKVKVGGKVANDYRTPTDFYGSIAESVVPLSIPATGKYLIQAGATWNMNGITGESTTTKKEEECEGTGKASFSITKEQRIAGEPAFTTEPLTVKLGASEEKIVEYHVVVKNTGNKPLAFTEFKDETCEKIKGGPTKELAPGESATYTCSRTIKTIGTYTNEASVVGNQGVGKQVSNTVTVNAPPEPHFTITKEQKIAGDPSYVKTELTTEFGKTVVYKIVVKNTGNVNLKFSEFVDGNCENIKGGPGEAELKPGESATYSCEHIDNTVGKYSNQATVTGTPPLGQGFPVTESSNKVEANIIKKASFTIKKSQRIGAGSYSESEITNAKIGQVVEYHVVVTNTGNVALTFGSLSDPNCELITGGATELAPKAETTFSCQHTLTSAGSYSNEASIEGSEGSGTKSSNVVVAKVPEEAEFTIEKLQRVIGEPSYTTEPVTGNTGQTLEYKIVVKNTGNIALTFGALKDANCESAISPAGATGLAPNAEETFTCTRVLGNSGTYTNEASIEGSNGTGTKSSNIVTAKVGPSASFTVEKRERIGAGAYTTGPLTGELGQTVEYEVIVKNTGNVTIKFGALKDTGCEGISPSGTTELAAGAEETFTCSHKLASVGSYTNEASIKGNEGGEQTSNKVTVNVESEPSFTIEKLEKIVGEGTFTAAEHTAEVGETVDYEVIVKNTGNVPLTFANFSDANCTNIKGGPAKALEPGESATYTCEHTLAKTGPYSNQASVEANPPPGDGMPFTHNSNTVVVDVPENPEFTIVKLQRIQGEVNYTISPLKAKLGQTIEYKIVIKNTGNMPLEFTPLVDANCEGISPSGETELNLGQEESFTCSHVLTSVGIYKNSASIEANDPIKGKSNEVEVEVPSEPSYTIEKQQKIKGVGSFGTSELNGKLGQTVEYRIIVKNTGNVTLKFQPLKDTGCEGLTPSGATELKAGEEETFTCTHVLAVGTYTNEASIEGDQGTGKESSEVTAKVAEEPSFTIEKQQRIFGEPFYTVAELTAELGEKIEYQIIVNNTGNVPLKFGALKDPKCEGISPSGATELAVGTGETFLCSHVLGVGTYTNEASIEGNKGGTGNTNKVTVKVPAKPNFTIEKQQKIKGEGSFGTGELTGKMGQTVEYKVIVKNTGNVPLNFGALSDTGCEGISPTGTTELAVGKEESFTCTHVLAVGTYTNEASITGNEGAGTKGSDKVVAKVPAEPNFTIEKQQRLKGEANYGAAELTGVLGQTVEYKIVVKNTGNVTLKFGALTDGGCENITPAGATELTVGEEESFTCTHVLTVGATTNEASITGNEGSGTKGSNKVVAKVPAEPDFTIEKLQRIQGEGTYVASAKAGKAGQIVEYKIIVKNTGNVPLKFGALSDTGCEGISPAGATELNVGEEESFTCTHTLVVGTNNNEASIAGNEGTGTKSSNKVTTTVASEPTFSIEKFQRIAGEPNYTTSEVTGALNQTVEYKVVVTNTGNVPLSFGALTDTGCEGVTPPGTTELAVGKAESFTCTHKLSSVGSYTNEASITGNEGAGTKTSNKVTAKVNAEPSFTIEKQQKIQGEGSYGAGELTGKIGQKVEYKIVVKNTGNVSLKFGALSDSGCEGISPSGETTLAAGAEESFTCTHKLTAVGSYTNEASITGNEGTGTKTSNKVTAKVNAEPSFTIEKQQKIEGEGTYTSAEHTGKIGQKVEYKIIVRNTGNVSLKFSALSDSGCEGISPSGETTLAAGAEESFTCTHKLSSVGSYTNEASITGNEGTGTKTSNKVTAKVNAEPSFTIENLQRLAGEGSYGVAEKTGALGQTVEYKVVVKNTGNVKLSFSALSDSGCTGISPSGTTELAAGAEESFTCSHVLAVGSYTNEASITGNEGTGTKGSNKVTAKVPVEPTFTITKVQKIAGESSYTEAERSGKIGQTVEYKVTVKNTGNVTIKFSTLKDTGCEGISPSGTTELASGKEETFTCTHKLSSVGSYVNEASIEGNEGAGTKTSNKVTAKVPAEPSFTIAKSQRLEGESSYTTSEKSAQGGQTAEYKIVVKNTGNVPLKFQALKDTGCENISPSGATEVAAGGEEIFTCEHTFINIGTYSNEASIEGNEGTGTRTSNKVSMKVSAKAAFTIEKQQRLKGETNYTTSELTGEVGQVVEYKIIVKNTGNQSIQFGSLKDTACSGISPSGSTELAPGKEETFTCSHTLTASGTYSNEASIEGCSVATETSNKVTVKVIAKPSFTIEKQQKISGESSYTTSEKSAEVGQSMNYLIVVKNTGNVPLKFAALKDSGCAGLIPSGTTELAAGKEESFTCSHTLASAGTYTNEASIEGNEGTGTKTSNKVSAKITPKPAFTIEKLQRLSGESGYNKNELNGKYGQKVEYKIVVKNTGNVPLKFQALKDSGCENISPSGTTELQNGKEESFTCEHTLTGTGGYSNEASIEGNEGTGTKTSNKVTANVKTEPNYTIEKLQRIGAEPFNNETRNATNGQTVEYEILVKNTGNVSLTFSNFVDEHCDAGTIAGGPSGALKAGETAVYTCHHVLNTTDESHKTFTNEASITGNEGTGTKKSNKVEVTVLSKCANEKLPFDVDARWHYSAGGSPGNWSNEGDIVCGKQISFGPQAMEGEQRLKPGTAIKGGWDFHIAFNTQTWSVKFAEGRIIFRHITCEKGETPLKELLEIKLPEATYSAFNSEWFPSGSQSSEAVYQGKATIPAICGPHGENNVVLGKNWWWTQEGGGTWEGYMTMEKAKK
ncbi:MAG TPA: hypothetical protein VMI13_02610 [Solirubrobacteraceae bacterium]|nr:hypothetical protein [Solirubrobacteraceae bacterium]